MSAPIVIVADAAPDVGMGHVSRSSAVAVALRARGERVDCLAHGAGERFVRDGVEWAAWPEGGDPGALAAEALVLDGARLPAVAGAVVFHDGGPLARGLALVVAPIAEPVRTEAQWLGGLDYACLRPVFWGLGRRAVRPAAERVLVTTGAGSDGDALAEVLATRLACALDAGIRVVRGPHSGLRVPDGVELLDAPASLHDALLDADLVVCSAGQTSLEAAACGTPAVLIGLDRPQAEQAARVADAGAGIVAAPEDPGAIVAAAAELAVDRGVRERMAAAGQAAVDGYGALRVAYRVAGLRRPRGAAA